MTIPIEDVEVTTSPYIDPSQPINQQSQVFLGHASRLQDWSGDGPNPPEPMQITVSQPHNPFFADYQPQNCAVLSFYDDLAILNSAGTPISHYTEAAVSYTVMGYHVTNTADPLYVASSSQSLADRLAACNLAVDPLSSALDPHFSGNMRSLCYGSIINLPWKRPPLDGTNSLTYPADGLQQSFLKSHPVSIGTNPIDALFGWLRSTESGEELTTDAVRRNLLKLQTLILDINDDVDSQLQAEGH